MSMHRWWVKKAIGVIALIALAAAGLGWLVMALWNWLLPPLFGLSAITFWQGLGLFLLGRLLFGGMRFFGGGHHHYAQRQQMYERWKSMSPEERESFSRGLRRGCRWGARHESESSGPESRNFVARS